MRADVDTFLWLIKCKFPFVSGMFTTSIVLFANLKWFSFLVERNDSIWQIDQIHKYIRVIVPINFYRTQQFLIQNEAEKEKRRGNVYEWAKIVCTSLAGVYHLENVISCWFFFFDVEIWRRREIDNLICRWKIMILNSNFVYFFFSSRRFPSIIRFDWKSHRQRWRIHRQRKVVDAFFLFSVCIFLGDFGLFISHFFAFLFVLSWRWGEIESFVLFFQYFLFPSFETNNRMRWAQKRIEKETRQKKTNSNVNDLAIRNGNNQNAV